LLTKDLIFDPGNLVVAVFAVYLFTELLATRTRNQRTDARATSDRGSLALIVLSLAGALVVAIVARLAVPMLDLPGPVLVWGLIGAAVFLAGMALRVSAIRTLGQAYSTVVTIQPGQGVITHGPYRLVRHPAYTGLLLMLAGAGLSTAHAGALAAGVGVPLPALLYRIRLEEPVLLAALGEKYEAYARTKKRLIPGVW
jgi:protein-S-isoprenylcysteine O-methyltransferase Ste14